MSTNYLEKYEKVFKKQSLKKCNSYKPTICNKDPYQCLSDNKNKGSVCNYYPYLCLQERIENQKYVKPKYDTSCVQSVVWDNTTQYTKVIDTGGAPVDYNMKSSIDVSDITSRISKIVNKN
tara:strand:- start:134 stop:496 length:363 start_codon:yes stop_codon:yes gene_type:complete